MTHALYLVGPIGAGKSTVLAEVRDQLGLVTGDWFKVWPTTHAEFRAEPLEDIVTGEPRGINLGVTRGEFSGTDAIGMASHSEAMAWLAEAPELPPLILGEGARLGTAKFLEALAERAALTVGYLYAPDDVLAERLEARWASQTGVYTSGRVRPKETFIKGNATRAAKAITSERFPVVRIDTSQFHPLAAAARLIVQAGLAAYPLERKP